MDKYGVSAPDFFRIDDLLDFSNDELFSTDASSGFHHHQPLSDNTSVNGNHFKPPNDINYSTDFTNDLCVPNDDVAELEWLSKFVDDSFTDFPANSFTGAVNVCYDTSVHGRSRTKRSKAISTNTSWTSSPESETLTAMKSKTNTKKREKSLTRDLPPSPSSLVDVERRCTHCASEKTPQWRTGPLGPKTLCNACGVRFKSGRLVPEYRPAASPTFVMTQHSNSHRKVLELRQQKEELHRQQQQLYEYHRQDFEVC